MESGRQWIRGLTAAFVTVLALACSGKSATHDRDSGDANCKVRGDCATGGTSGTGGGTSGSATGGNVAKPIFVYDENVYRYVNELELPTVEVKPTTDLEICWTDVLSDLACGDVDPLADIDNVGLLRTTLTVPDLVGRLADGELDMTDIDAYVSYPTDHQSTCAPLSAFTLFGTEMEPGTFADDGVHGYLLVFTRGSTPGNGSVTMVILKPTTGSENTNVDAPAGCDLLHVTTDFSSVEPVAIPIDGPFVIDWSNVTRPWSAETATIWRVSPEFADYESHLLELDALATEIWDVPLEGKRADLALARSRWDGRAFQGFLSGDIWLLGLTCTSCGLGSVPPVLSVVEPVAP